MPKLTHLHALQVRLQLRRFPLGLEGKQALKALLGVDGKLADRQRVDHGCAAFACVHA